MGGRLGVVLLFAAVGAFGVAAIWRFRVRADGEVAGAAGEAAPDAKVRVEPHGDPTTVEAGAVARTPIAVQAPTAAVESPQTELPSTIRGRVLNPDGSPVPGLVVAFEPSTNQGVGPLDSRFRTTAERDGSFELPAPGRSGRLTVDDSTFVVAYSAPWFGSKPLDDVIVIVAPRCGGRGIVVFGDGSPAEGAEITMCWKGRASDRLPLALPGLGVTLWRGVADTSGQFVFDDVPCVASALFRVEKAGHPSVARESANSDWSFIELRLGAVTQGSFKVRGIVLDTRGHPQEGARVGAGGLIAVSSKDGRFEVICEEATPTVIAVKPGFAPAMEQVRASNERSNEEITLVLADASSSIRGVLVDALGEPVPEGWVTSLTRTHLGRLKQRVGDLEFERATTVEALLAGAEERLRDREWVRCDREGRFELLHLADREYALLLIDPRDLSNRHVVGVVPSPVEQTFELHTATSARVAGTVVNLRGGPIAGAQVSPRVRDPSRSQGWLSLPAALSRSVITDENGEFELGLLVLSSASLWVRGPDDPHGLSFDLALPAGHADLRIAIPAAMQFSVLLQSADTDGSHVAVEDASGVRLPLSYEHLGATLVSTSAPLAGRQSVVLGVTELATTVVLLNGETEVGRTAMPPSSSDVIIVHF
jgi:hypothetical protein